jgi:hypothetical protein
MTRGAFARLLRRTVVLGSQRPNQPHCVDTRVGTGVRGIGRYIDSPLVICSKYCARYKHVYRVALERSDERRRLSWTEAHRDDRGLLIDKNRFGLHSE